MNDPGARRLRVGSLLVALAIAAASSAWQIGMRSLWIDEAISLGATRQLARTIRGTGGTMALYYVLLDGWTAIVGTSPIALRTLSLLLVLLLVVVASAVFHRLLPGPEAALATVITAAIPGIVQMAQDARTYALLALIVAACWWCLTRAVEATTAGPPGDVTARRWLLALVPLAVAGPLTQGLFLLHLLPLVLSVVVLGRRWWVLRWMAPAVVAAVAATGGLLAIGADDVGDWIPALSRDQVDTALRSVAGGPGWALAVIGALAVAGAATLLRGAVAMGRGPVGSSGADHPPTPDHPSSTAPPRPPDRRDRTAVGTDLAGRLARWPGPALVLWAFLPLLTLLALSTVRPTFLGRYLLPSVPALGALLAAAVAAAWRTATQGPATGATRPADGQATVRPWAARAGAVGLTVALVAALVSGRIEKGGRPYEDWDSVVAFVAAQAEPDDGLIFPHATGQAHEDTVRAPFEAAWLRLDDPPALAPLSPTRPLGEVRRFDDLTPPDELAERMVDHPRVWAVEFPGFHASLKHLMALEPARTRFRNVGVTTFGGGIQVVELERLPPP